MGVSIILLLCCKGNAYAQVQYGMHTCIVLEVLNSGGYSYVRCQDGSQEIWLCLPQTSLNIGEQVSYLDAPPMINFHSKGLNRVFPEVRFVPGVSRAGERSLSTKEATTEGRNVTSHKDQESVYIGTDDRGTLMFTDDPSKAPKGSRERIRVASPEIKKGICGQASKLLR
jgi:hypothetical protein